MKEFENSYLAIEGDPTPLIDTVAVLLSSLALEKGGPGSGNFGHRGRPGSVGGSGGGRGGVGGAITSEDDNVFDATWANEVNLADSDDPKAANEFVQLIGQRNASAIALYSSQEHWDMNEPLREGYAMDSSHVLLSKYVDAGLAKIPAQPGVTYRGMRKPSSFNGTTEDFVNSRFRKNSFFTDNAYMSTTMTKEMTRNFTGATGGIVITIKGKSGRVIDSLSVVGNEKEVLFPRGSLFKVTSVKQSGDQFHVSMTEQKVKAISEFNKDFTKCLTESDAEHYDAMSKASLASRNS